MDQQDVTVYLLAPNPSTPYFYAQWVEPGTTRRRTRSLRTADPDQAERARGELEYELRHGQHASAERLSWANFVARYTQEKLPGLGVWTQKTVARVLREFEQAARPRSLAQVDARQVALYLASLRGRDIKPVTQRTLLAHLKSALRWAHEQKLRGPAPAFPKLKVPRKSNIRTVSAERFDALLRALPAPWAFLAQVAWFTGMRVGELQALTWQRSEGGAWVDFDRSRIYLSAEATKGNAERWVPLHPDLLPLLQDRARATGRVFELAPNAQELSHRFCRKCRSLGFDVLTHDLRRTFASRYAPLVPAPILQQLMGHRDIRTTLEFYTDVDGALDEAIKKA